MKKLPLITICLFFLGILFADPSFAAAVVTLNSPSSGSSATVNVNINTNGTSENTFDIVVSYVGSVDGINETTTGGICNVPAPTPAPGGGQVEISCGKTNGFSGSGTIGFISVSLSGSATFSISRATVYMNDGHGTFDSVSTGGPVTINSSGGTATPTPTPTPSASGTPTASPTSNGPTPTPTAKTTPISGQPPGSFNAKPTPKPTITTANQPTLIVVTQPKANSTPTPIIKTIIITPSGTAKSDISTLVQGYFNNAAAALLFILPLLILIIMVAFMSIRMFQMTRRRQREIELLFEHELGELAALESKMDILNEKGSKGKDEFRQEFERTRDELLREIKPDYIGNGDKEKPKE